MAETSPNWVETLAKMVATSIPVVGGPLEVLIGDIRARRSARAVEFLERISRAGDEQDFVRRLSLDPRLENLFVSAVESALATSLEAKRAALASAISNAAFDPSRVDKSESVIEALTQLDVQHVRALRLLADEWNEACASPTDESLWGMSRVWQELPAHIRAALVRTGVAKPETNTFMQNDGEPHRQVGISDFGLEVLSALRAEGWQD
jgi:hypothetical protein